jgi:hypothetical protein
MQKYDEKRAYSRMEIDCEVTYRLTDSEMIYHGRCVSISGAGMAFIADQAIETGKALEATVMPGNKSIPPPLTAIIEAVRCTRLEDGNFGIAAAIKGIKAD